MTEFIRFRGNDFLNQREVAWAVMFDRFGWEYAVLSPAEYRPRFTLDLHHPTLVEVVADMTGATVAQHRLPQLRLRNEALVLTEPFAVFNAGPAHLAGKRVAALGGLHEGLAASGWSHAVMFFCLRCKMWSYYHAAGHWNCRVCGSSVEPLPTSEEGFVDIDLAKRLWAKADEIASWYMGRSIR